MVPRFGINLKNLNHIRYKQAVLFSIMIDARVSIYSAVRCPICDKTKHLLNKWGIAYREVRVDTDRAGLIEMARLTDGARTVPQIAIDDLWIGGFTELTELHMDGELDDLMRKD